MTNTQNICARKIVTYSGSTLNIHTHERFRQLIQFKTSSLKIQVSRIPAASYCWSINFAPDPKQYMHLNTQHTFKNWPRSLSEKAICLKNAVSAFSNWDESDL